MKEVVAPMTKLSTKKALIRNPNSAIPKRKSVLCANELEESHAAKRGHNPSQSVTASILH